jgi:hypothetical protein
MGDAGRNLQSIELAVGRWAGRKLAAILATDVIGYSSPMGCDESGTLARLLLSLDR